MSARRLIGSGRDNRWRVNETSVDFVRAERRPRPVELPASPQNIRLDLARTAFVIVDMQNDFCHPEGWLGALANGSHVLELGSWSAAIVDEFGDTAGDIHVAKYAMSGFRDTPIDSILRNLGVTTLLFAGVNLDQCVLCTLQDASFRGYDCVLVEQCCATTSPAFCAEAALYNIRQCFGFVASDEALAAALSRGVPGMDTKA